MLTALLLAAAEYDPKTHVQDVLLMGTKDAPVLTMHMVTLALSGLITVALLLLVSKSIATGQSGEGNAVSHQEPFGPICGSHDLLAPRRNDRARSGHERRSVGCHCS